MAFATTYHAWDSTLKRGPSWLSHMTTTAGQLPVEVRRYWTQRSKFLKFSIRFISKLFCIIIQLLITAILPFQLCCYLNCWHSSELSKWGKYTLWDKHTLSYFLAICYFIKHVSQAAETSHLMPALYYLVYTFPMTYAKLVKPIYKCEKPNKVANSITAILFGLQMDENCWK